MYRYTNEQQLFDFLKQVGDRYYLHNGALPYRCTSTSFQTMECIPLEIRQYVNKVADILTERNNDHLGFTWYFEAHSITLKVLVVIPPVISWAFKILRYELCQEITTHRLLAERRRMQ